MRAPGLVNFVLALAYHFCLNLPAAFTQPRARLLVEPCIIPKFGVKMAIFVPSGCQSPNWSVVSGIGSIQDSNEVQSETFVKPRAAM